MKALGYTLRSDIIDTEAVDFFTAGQCWALAEVLERELGWWTVLASDSDPNGDNIDNWYHAMSVHDNGMVVDINGWGADDGHPFVAEYVPWSYVELAYHCFDGYMDEVTPSFRYYRRRSLEVAEAFIPALLESLDSDSSVW